MKNIKMKIKKAGRGGEGDNKNGKNLSVVWKKRENEGSEVRDHKVQINFKIGCTVYLKSLFWCPVKVKSFLFPWWVTMGFKMWHRAQNRSTWMECFPGEGKMYHMEMIQSKDVLSCQLKMHDKKKPPDLGWMMGDGGFRRNKINLKKLKHMRW